MDTLRRMVTGLLLLLIFMTRSAQTVDGIDPHRIISDPTQDPKSDYSKVTCDFANDTCGWKNVGGYDYPLTWRRKRNNYMRLKMNGAGNSKGRLASPWLSPLSFHSCRLRFQYYIPNSQKMCRLSLYRQARSGEERRLWSTQKGTGFLNFSPFIYQEVNCTAGTLRMVFEGWKTCHGAFYNEIDVKSIKFTVYPEDGHSPTDPTPSGVDTTEHVPTGTPSVWVPDSSSSRSSRSSSSSSSNDYNSSSNSNVSMSPGVTSTDPTSQPGLLAGIIVTVVVVVVIVGVLIIVIVVVRRRRRRRRRQRGQKDLVSQLVTGTTTNSTHGLELQHVAGNSGTDNRGHHPHTTMEDNYEVV